MSRSMTDLHDRPFAHRSVRSVDRAASFLQRGRIACNAERCNTYSNSVCLSVRPSVGPSVRPSVTRWYPIQTNEHRITRSSL